MAINKTGIKRGALISKHQKAGDGWEDLAATVNEQAAKDYKWCLNHPGKCLQTDGKAETKQTLEAFFAVSGSALYARSRGQNWQRKMCLKVSKKIKTNNTVANVLKG